MGYLTPFLVHNDVAHMLLNSPDVGTEMHKAVSSFKDGDIFLNTYEKVPWWKFWKKPDKRFKERHMVMEALATEHNSVTRVIVVHGNTWVDLTESQQEGSYAYFKECLKLAEAEIKAIKARLNPPKKKKKAKK